MRTANNRHNSYRYLLSTYLVTGTMLKAYDTMTHVRCVPSDIAAGLVMIGKKKGRNGEKANCILF